MSTYISSSLPALTIDIYDPFAEHLGGPAELVRFSLSVVDAGRLSGHLCASITGAFLIARAAVQSLFQDHVCIRGLLEVGMPNGPTQGASGPMSHVFSQITGAWDQTGFGGLGGPSGVVGKRRDLLRFNHPECQPGSFFFRRTDTGEAVHVSFHPDRAFTEEDAQSAPREFPASWRHRVDRILANADRTVEVRRA